MAKLAPKVKYGCPKCKADIEKLESALADIDIILSEPQTMKQTTIIQKKPKSSSKVVSLF